MPLDISTDMALFDFTETVSIQRYTTAGVLSSTDTGILALRREIKGEVITVGDGAQINPDKARWHLQASTVPTPPRRGDRIVSALSGSWVILNDDVEAWGTRYVCDCQRAS